MQRTRAITLSPLVSGLAYFLYIYIYIYIFFFFTVDPLYNIRYSSKIRYNVNLVCTKISRWYIFHWYSHVFLQENLRFVYMLESPRRGDSNKYIKRVIKKNLFKSIHYSCFRRVHIKFFYNSKFDLRSKPDNAAMHGPHSLVRIGPGCAGRAYLQ